MGDDTTWGGVASWYDEVVSDADSYQQKVLLPNSIRLCAVKKGEYFLDVACGQGLFSRALAQAGARVVGIDIAPELIALARKVVTRSVSYQVCSAERLEGMSDGVYDGAICVLALQNIANTSAAFAEVSRVLKPQGRFIFVLNHPCFRIPKRSSWGFDERESVQYRRIDGYLSEARVPIVMNPGTGGTSSTVSFHRPLQLFFKQLVKYGFLVGRVEEWESHKKSEPGPRAIAEDKIRKEIPLFLAVEAYKIGHTL